MSVVAIIGSVSGFMIAIGATMIVYGTFSMFNVRSEEIRDVKKVEAKAKAEVKVLHQSEETAKRLQHRDLRAVAAVRLELRVLKDIERDYAEWLTLLQVSEKQKCLTAKETKQFQKKYRAIIKNIHVLTGRALRREKRAERGVISLDRKLITELKHATNDHEAFLKASTKLRQSPGTTHSELGLLLKKLEQEQLDPKVTNEVKSELAYWIKLIEFRQKLVLRLQIIEKNFEDCKLPLGQTGNDVKLSTALQNLRSEVGGKKPFDYKIHGTTVGDIEVKIKVVIQQNDIKPIITDYHKLEGEMGVLVHNEGEQEKKIEEEAKVEGQDTENLNKILNKNLRQLQTFTLDYNPNTQSVYHKLFLDYKRFLTSNKHIYKCIKSNIRNLMVQDVGFLNMLLNEFGVKEKHVLTKLNGMEPAVQANVKSLSDSTCKISTQWNYGHLQFNVGTNFKNPKLEVNIDNKTFKYGHKLYYRVGYNFDASKDAGVQLDKFVQDYQDGVNRVVKVMKELAVKNKSCIKMKCYVNANMLKYVAGTNPDALIVYADDVKCEKQITKAFYQGNMYDPGIHRHKSAFDFKRYSVNGKKVDEKTCDAKHYLFAYDSKEKNSYSFFEGKLYGAVLFTNAVTKMGTPFIRYVLDRKVNGVVPATLRKGLQESITAAVKQMKGYEYPHGANPVQRQKYFEGLLDEMEKIDLQAQAIRSKISKKAA